MNKLRYFIVTMVKSEPNMLVGGMSSEIRYVGLKLDRFVRQSDLIGLQTIEKTEFFFESMPVATGFIEVSAEDYNVFFEKEEASPHKTEGSL